MRRHILGFTLIELLASIAIASILLMLAIPAWSSLRQHTQTTALTQALLQSITYARTQAILRHQIITIAPINNDWQQGWSISSGTQHNLLKTIPMPAPAIPLRFIVLRNNNQLIIQPDGTTAGSNGHFEFNQVRLMINRGGRVRMMK